MYTVMGADQQEYGPVDAGTLREWLQENRVNAQTQARSVGESAWRPLGELPEFADLFAESATSPPGSVPTLAPSPARLQVGSDGTGRRKTGFATASLVLGVSALLCGGVLFGLPAVILGHIARGRARRSPAEYGGAGTALGGLITGYCSIVVTALLLLWLPSRIIPRAPHTECISNVKLISVALRMYANDHDGVLPPDFLAVTNDLVRPKYLVCPDDKERSPAAGWDDLSPAHISYEYLAAGSNAADVLHQVIVRCPIHGHQGYGDGSVTRAGEPRSSPTRRR